MSASTSPHPPVFHLWAGPAATWLALQLLLAATVASAYVPLGPFNLVINLLVAGIKAAPVGLFFMHLARSSALLRMTACAAMLWLAFLFALTLTDYMSRG